MIFGTLADLTEKLMQKNFWNPPLFMELWSRKTPIYLLHFNERA